MNGIKKGSRPNQKNGSEQNRKKCTISKITKGRITKRAASYTHIFPKLHVGTPAHKPHRKAHTFFNTSQHV